MVSGMAAQLMAMNGPSLRGLAAWMKRLSTSLPVPVGPLISTGMSLAARRSARARTDRLSGSAAIGLPAGVAQAISAHSVLWASGSL